MPPSSKTGCLDCLECLLSSSEVISDGYVDDLSYGGVADGSVTPEAKQYNVWDDDWSD